MSWFHSVALDPMCNTWAKNLNVQVRLGRESAFSNVRDARRSVYEPCSLRKSN